MDKYTSVPFQSVEITDGFWHARQQINRDVTIGSILTQFRNTGRFDAFRFDWKEGMPNKPHIFYDSDIAKWIESVAYILEKQPNPELEQIVDEVVELIEEHQEENGYFNIWFTVLEPDQRFQKRTEHELYCAGHLIEAAVAYANATGKDKFLRLMCKYADHIERVFKLERSAAFITPGHEEIELALVKLYEATGERRYLDLSKYFIDERGQHEEERTYGWGNARYAQDHLPVREQTTAEGHSVRATYLYSAMADIAWQYGDESLRKACRTLFENMAYKRMYVTGGIGSSRIGEAFTVDYDLPNTTAYTETCAALALALFARRMLKMDADSLYADVAELAMYNGFLSGTSLDGKCFFYENPLEIDLNRIGRNVSVNEGEEMPITQRVEVFSCSCCPPNVTRFIASIADFLYTYDSDRLYIHHFMAGNATFAIDGRPITIAQRTKYPVDGAVEIEVNGAKGMDLFLRVPGWCHSFTIKQGDQDVAYTMEKGYARVSCASDACALTVHFAMEPELLEAHGRVRDDAGRVALRRGPIVYCMEAIDQEAPLNELMVNAHLEAELIPCEETAFPTIRAQGVKRILKDPDALYQPLNSRLEPAKLTFIPYYAFANRGETDMQVWVMLKW